MLKKICAFVIFTSSLQLIAAQPKPWNVCAVGHTLPSTPIRYESLENGTCTFATLQDSQALFKIIACPECYNTVVAQLKTKIEVKYGYFDTATQQWIVETRPPKLVLHPNGEIEEWQATFPKKQAETKPASAALQSSPSAETADKK